MPRRRTVSSGGFLEFFQADREQPPSPAEGPPGWSQAATTIKRGESKFVVDDMRIQLPPIPSPNLEPHEPPTDKLDFGYSYTQDRRIPDPRESRSLPSSLMGSPTILSSGSSHKDYLVTDCDEVALASAPSSPHPTPQGTEVKPRVEDAHPAPEIIVRSPTPVQGRPLGVANANILPDSSPDSPIKAKTAVIPWPSPAPSSWAAVARGPSHSPIQSPLPTPPSTTLLSPSPVLTTPATASTTISSSVVALPTADTTPGPSGAATPAATLAPTSLHFPQRPPIQKAPAAVRISSTPISARRAKNAERLGRSQRDKLDHNRERREAREAEEEARIANRREARRKKKQKREAKLEVRALQAALQEVKAENVETPKLAQEGTVEADGTDDINDTDAAFNSLQVAAESQELPSVPEPQTYPDMAVDDTLAATDELSLDVCESTALENSSLVSDLQPSKGYTTGLGSEVIGHLERHLEDDFAPQPSSTAPAESSKAKKKKAKKAKKAKAKAVKEAKQLEMAMKKTTIPLPFDDAGSDDDDDAVEAVLYCDSPAAITPSETPVGLGLIDRDLTLGNSASSQNPPSSLEAPVSPNGAPMAATNDAASSRIDSTELPQAVESNLDLLSAVALHEHSKAQGVRASMAPSAVAPSPATSSLAAAEPAASSLGLIFDDISTSCIRTTFEPAEPAATVPASKSKSKKHNKKAAAPAPPNEASQAGSPSPPSVARPIPVGKGTGGVPMESHGPETRGGVQMERQGRGNLGRRRQPVTKSLQEDVGNKASTEMPLGIDLETLPPLPPSPGDTPLMPPQISPQALPQPSLPLLSPSSSTSSCQEILTPPLSPLKHYPSWWYPWALLKHLRLLRIRALHLATRPRNGMMRRWAVIALSPLLSLQIDDYFQPLREQQYDEGTCDSLSSHWKVLVQVVWKTEGAFSRMEGWEQFKDVPASFGFDTFYLASPRLRDILGIAQDEESDWMRLDEVVKENLAKFGTYISSVAERKRRDAGSTSPSSSRLSHTSR